jgi:hypothetical protein
MCIWVERAAFADCGLLLPNAASLLLPASGIVHGRGFALVTATTA